MAIIARPPVPEPSAPSRPDGSANTPRTQSGHDRLVRMAESWLRGYGCGVVICELRTINPTGEIPDVLGWKSGYSILIECKDSRSDFLADQHKRFRVNPESGAGDWRFYLCPEDVIRPEDLPAGWGLLHAVGRRVIPICGVPSNVHAYSDRPFSGNRDVEACILTSLVRRERADRRRA